MKNSIKISLGGIITGFSLILMLLTNIIPVGTYAVPMLAGMLLVSVVIEFGTKWGYLAYVAVGLLSLLMSGDKEAVMYFLLFFGYYPILKSTIERLNSKLLQYLIKYAIFNVAIISAFFIAKLVLLIPDEEFTIFGVYVPWIFLILGNVIFIFYDYCVTLVVVNYINKIRNRIFKLK